MMVLENNAIECEWQIVENENIVVNNLEGIEIVVDLQPKHSRLSVFGINFLVKNLSSHVFIKITSN